MSLRAFELISEFRKRKTATLPDLISLTGQSGITVRRRLKQWKSLTSYNHNGRYYVLPDIPRFDSFGLWNCDGVRFSRFGNLSNTIVHMIGYSENGMDASHLSEILGRGIHSLLARLTERGKLKREKHAGRHIYFSHVSGIMEKQRSKRISREKLPSEFSSAGVAILVLVEKIKYPDLSVPGLVNSLRKQGVNVNIESVTDFFTRHGLLKKT